MTPQAARPSHALAAALLGGCHLLSAAGEPAAPEPDAIEAPGAWVEAPRTHLAVAAAHAYADPRASLLPIRIDGASPSALAPLSLPAREAPPGRGRFDLVAAHDGQTRLVVASGTGDYSVEIYDLDDQGEPARHGVGSAPPAALHVVGHQVFVGQPATLSVLDLANPAGGLRQLAHRPEMGAKAYDLFARDGAHLVAIDDVVRPIYADAFDLAGAEPAHRAAFELPGAVNGHYAHAALRGGSTGDAALFALVPFGIMTGHGHSLVRVDLRDGAPTRPLGRVILNSGGRATLPVVEEFKSRIEQHPSRLVAGEALTPWRGLSWASTPEGGVILVAAGERGLLVFPDDFASPARPAVHDVGGSCLDVLADDGRVWALRAVEAEDGPPRHELVELGLSSGDRSEVLSVLPLDGSYDRFLR